MNKKIQALITLVALILTQNSYSAHNFSSKDKAPRAAFTVPKLSINPVPTHTGKIKTTGKRRRPEGLISTIQEALEPNPGPGYVEIPGKHYTTKKQNGKKRHEPSLFPVCKWPKNLKNNKTYKVKKIGLLQPKLFIKSVDKANIVNIQSIDSTTTPSTTPNNLPFLPSSPFPINEESTLYLTQTMIENNTTKQMIYSEKPTAIYPEKTERLFNKYGAGW